jgi:hypothetical protein
MKIQILLFSMVLLIINICSSELLFASQSMIVVNLPITSCLDKVNINNMTPDFKNWYHANLSDWDIQKHWLEARKAVCSFYVAWWDINRIQLASIIPIYIPKIESPIWLQNIYIWQDYLYPERIWYKLWGWNAKSLPEGKSLYWFQFGGFGWRAVSEDRIVYLKSLEEPFRSAPIIQMYRYGGSPLLVARSNTGIVTNVFFQNHRNILDPMLRAQKYLWEKWYHP